MRKYLRYSLIWLFVLQLSVGLFFGFRYWAWQPSEEITARLEYRDIWDTGNLVREAPIFCIVYHHHRPHPDKSDFMGFPSGSNLDGWSILKVYFNPKDIKKLEKQAKEWIASKEGQKKICEARKKFRI